MKKRREHPEQTTERDSWLFSLLLSLYEPGPGVPEGPVTVALVVKANWS